MSVKMEGWDEFKRALTELPATLEREARDIVVDAAYNTAAQARMKYGQVKTGDGKALADHVTITTAHTKGYVKARVSNDLPYAMSFEFGSQIRKRRGKRGSTGAAPPSPTLIPVARSERGKMQARLLDMLRRNGLVTNGA